MATDSLGVLPQRPLSSKTTFLRFLYFPCQQIIHPLTKALPDKLPHRYISATMLWLQVLNIQGTLAHPISYSLSDYNFVWFATSPSSFVKDYLPLVPVLEIVMKRWFISAWNFKLQNNQIFLWKLALAIVTSMSYKTRMTASALNSDMSFFHG